MEPNALWQAVNVSAPFSMHYIEIKTQITLSVEITLYSILPKTAPEMLLLYTFILILPYMLVFPMVDFIL